ncbi:4762_t:CDS:2 [Funneliformis mosseae]|uniref:4762_t:CDS:1 n=1 Tax=Funneliformis mosseae TaxID=27381 RepID=A0A9N9CHF8_FUNMO|nr:4762_t:CDS:2 [Funneliformis mosseae]
MTSIVQDLRADDDYDNFSSFDNSYGIKHCMQLIRRTTFH